MRVEIKVFPRSSRTCIREEGGVYKAYVNAPPDKGKANKALIELAASYFGVKKSDIRIVSGKTSRKKVMEVIGK